MQKSKVWRIKNFQSFYQLVPKIYNKYGTVTVNHEGGNIKRFLTPGTPQGVLSPLAWNIALQSLLHNFLKGQVKVCGFADDACLIVTGESPFVFCFPMQEAIDKVLARRREKRLQFSGPKTVAVLLTHRRVFRTPPQLKMGSTELPFLNNV